ncbi:MAG: hypothetical protein KJ588_01540, partial [Gammaproteobacteria bacterium]|nr:hypothetical protein [Gammaproteobacteria bacterium]
MDPMPFNVSDSWMVQKRDGRCVTFDATKIFHAIRKAGSATSEFDERIAQQLMDTVLSALKQSAHQNALEVEHIQDLVEEVLLNTTYKKTAKA